MIHSLVYLDRVYLWRQSIEMRYDGWNRHDVKEERSQKVVREVSGDHWPANQNRLQSANAHGQTEGLQVERVEGSSTMSRLTSKTE